MFEKWGVLTYRRRKLLPVVCVLLIVVLYLLIGKDLTKNLSQEGWEDPGADSTIAQQLENSTFGRNSSGDVILLIQAPVGTTLDVEPTYSTVAQALNDFGAAHPQQIKDITGYFDTRANTLISEDHHTAFAAVSLNGDGEQTLKDFRAIKNEIPTSLPGNITVRVAGATAVADALDSGMSEDIHRAELLALPIIAVLLLFVFGSVVTALMPLIVGILTIMGSLSLLSAIGVLTQVNVFAQSIITLLGLGLAIDYGLFMVSRFREELALRGSASPARVRRAVIVTMVTAGKTVTFSAGMVAMALSGLFLFPQAFLKSIAYGAICSVVLAAFLSITLLPALFALLGDEINALSVRQITPRARTIKDTVWYRLPAWAMEHSKLVAAGLVGVLMLLSIPMLGTKFGGINETYLPPTHAVRQAQDDFNSEFPQFRTDPIKLVVANASQEQLANIYQQANAIPGLTKPFTPDHGTKDGVTVLSAGIADRNTTSDIIGGLRNISVPEGVTVHIGGTPAMEAESLEALFQRLPWMLGYILVVTFLLMAIAFGSAILPLKAILMTLLGLGATLGILTTIFVLGVFSGLFGFTPGPLMSPVLVLIIALVYGLSTDYEVFLISRMVESRDRGSSTQDAIRLGTAHTGSIITAAALIMIVVCGAFSFSDIVMMKYLAFGMIAALLLDATVIRMLLVPAVMNLLAEDCWWAPRFIRAASRRLGDHVHLEELDALEQKAPTHLPAGEAAQTADEDREDSDDAYWSVSAYSETPAEADTPGYKPPSQHGEGLGTAGLLDSPAPSRPTTTPPASPQIKPTAIVPDSQRTVVPGMNPAQASTPISDAPTQLPEGESATPAAEAEQEYDDSYEDDLEYWEYQQDYQDEEDEEQLELPIDVGEPLQLSEEEIWEAEPDPDYRDEYPDAESDENYWDESADYAIPLWETNDDPEDPNQQEDYSEGNAYDDDAYEYYQLPEYPGGKKLNRRGIRNPFSRFKRPKPNRNAQHDTDTGSLRVQDIAQRMATESDEFPRTDW